MAEYEVAVIGGGPGGYACAIRAGQLGKKVVLFERESLGGTCLNWGCIPSKALLKNADVLNLVRDAGQWGVSVGEVSADYAAAVDRSRTVVEKMVGGVASLLKGAGVDVVAAEASFKHKGVLTADGADYNVENVVLATGASTRMLPGAPIDGKTVITSREALALRKVPKRVVIIGAGPVGVEFAHVWASYGADVTLVEMLDDVVPQEDPDVSKQLRRSFGARGITSLIGTKFESLEKKSRSAVVTVSKDGEKTELKADVVLVAIGFVPHTASLNLVAANVETDRGFVTVDEQMRTNVPGVYSIGDVTGKMMLAHVATQQGIIAAEHIAGRTNPALDYIQMPRASFCQPQIGSVGYTEPAAKAAGFDVKTGRFPFAALGKAIAVGETEGFVKVVAEVSTGQVLGVHIIGHDITDLMGEASLASVLEATTKELGFAVHVHPTLSEALKEAALAADYEAIHITQRRAKPAAATGAR